MGMSRALSREVINTRLLRLRNLEKLYQEQKRRIVRLEETITLLTQENAVLRAENTELRTLIQTQALQIEALNTTVFGKKRQTQDDDVLPKPPSVPRTPTSYTRAIPSEEDVTHRVSHPIKQCSSCQGTLTRKKDMVYYVEDIPLPQKRVITKHTVEKGYCTQCHIWSTATPLPSARVILGEKVQSYTIYLSAIMRLSFSQIQELLKMAIEVRSRRPDGVRVLLVVLPGHMRSCTFTFEHLNRLA